MSISDLLTQLQQPSPLFVFNEVMDLINDQYDFSPCAFVNGDVENSADENQGSCRVFAFAQAHSLDQAETLKLFAEHYQQVLSDPDGDSHGNIRAFMKNGWNGVVISGQPLTPKS